MDTKALRQKILDLAIHGKLVPQDPNDEPASVLLERIKAEKERLIKEGKIKRSKKSAKTSDTPHYENVPFEVPEGWMWTTLGVIGTWQSGGTPSRSNKSYYGGNIPWLKTGDLNDGYITHIPEFITEEAVVNSSAKLNPVGSVLIAMYGATIGKLGILTFPATTNQACCACIEYDAIDPMFLFYFLLSQRTAFIAKGGGGAQPNISKEIIVKTYIPLPPFLEQQRIVAEIERWFSLIDIIENGKNDLQNIIKQTKNKILDLAIHGKLVSQDPNDEPAIELLKRINPGFTPCDNGHYTNLPKGWAICKLSDLCRIENGFAFSSNDYKSQGIPLVRISNITHNTIDITDCVYVEGITDNKFKISKGDLLIAMSGATTGKMGVYLFDEIAYLNQRVGNIKILNKSSLFPDYRNIYMQSKVDEILKIAYGGAQPNISASVIGNFDFPLPPYKEQIRIVETVQRIFDQLDTITESL
ncbi:restriction endonuclease subunit S [Bacteroides fragilis]|nr:MULTISPECIES: restriction endonuclease subunit S [Bacteroidales]MCE9186399.1 restriction endonuclease subunit S [Bacteroides fragilis]MBE7614389.1 restriction endonuclease subunit S [Bacteroides uniformis]MCB7369138.1 restriction endonuclease subunit S [Bacteroides caccae]MCE9042227.1 restriction endonuclease subunit S [Parabacteroides distasonis]MCQ5233958.1 restriction endonuclease subunit S [Bacteroides caccae]